MSRNIKSNLKNPPAKLLLKTIYNPRSNTKNEFYLSPYNMKNNSNLTTDYLSFFTHESINKSNKKVENGKINYFYKNYRVQSLNKEKERYNQTQTQSKQMSRNNSNKNDLLFNKSNLKNSFSTSKTNSNSLMISKINKKQKKTNNKIYKLLLKETEKNNNTLEKSNTKIKNQKKFSKNKSSNNIHLTRKINLLNSQNTISNNIQTKNNKINTNIIKNMHISKFNYNSKNNCEKKSKQNSKNKNLNLTINNIDKNSNHRSNNKILYANIIKTNHNKNTIKKLNINSFHKTCINTPMESYRKKEQIIFLNKEIEIKNQEIKNLKNIVKEKEIYIKNLEEKISSLNVTQNVDKEYEKYSKIIIVKNIKSLTIENEQLHKQIQECKNKEIKMMKLIQNMKKSGIDFDNILNKLDNNEELKINLNSKNSNNNESINSNKYDDIVLKTDTTNNTNITNNTFLPLNLNEEQKNISHKSCINLAQNLPELPLKNINDYFNENYFAQNGNDNIQIQIIDNNDCNILQK